jgi:hypothetical protein
MKISFSLSCFVGTFSIVLISTLVLAEAVSPKPFEFNETISTFSEAHVHHAFNKWMVEHGRNYSTSSEMIKRRYLDY